MNRQIGSLPKFAHNMSDLFRAEALEFANQRLEGEIILATPVSTKIYVFFCVIITISIVSFASFASYTRQQKVTGWLVPNGGLLRATTRLGGTVTAVLVKEGQLVRPGEPLVRIRVVTAMPDGRDTQRERSATVVSEAGALTAQAEATKAKLSAEGSDLAIKVHQLSTEVREIDAQIKLQEEIVKLSEVDVTRFERLVKEGAISQRQLDGSRTTMLGAKQTLAQEKLNAASARQQILDVYAREHALPSELALNSANLKASLGDLRERQIQSNSQEQDLIVAPIGGRILALPADVGQTLQAGGSAAIIAPTGSQLIAELYAPSRAIGFVAAGQKVKLMYEAFPHQKFGAANGRVISVSRTILSQSEMITPGTNNQEPFFRVRVALPDQVEHAYGQVIPLQPGMLLSANIQFDKRTLFEWLLDPIYAVNK